MMRSSRATARRKRFLPGPGHDRHPQVRVAGKLVQCLAHLGISHGMQAIQLVRAVDGYDENPAIRLGLYELVSHSGLPFTFGKGRFP